MNDHIREFITKQRVSSICCIDQDDNPYCFSCFYSVNAEQGLLYFKTSPDSHHSQLIKEGPRVAGTINPDKLNPLNIQGIQFTGEILPAEHMLAKNASRQYHKKYPIALAISGDVYTVRLDFIKMTERGKKLIWKREKYEDVSK